MEKKIKPPKICEWILSRLLRTEEQRHRLGDFDEVFYRLIDKKGIKKARRWYCYQIIKSLPGFMKNSFYWRKGMLNNYVKIAFRNLIRHKGYTVINIAGLAAGTACCLMLLLWAHDELSYDRFHNHYRDIYRIVVEKPSETVLNISPRTPAPLAPSLKGEFPEIVHATLYDEIRWRIKKKEDSKNVFYEEGGVTNSDFFKIFSFEFLKGKPENVFNNPLSVVLTEELAEKCFGKEEPLGQTIIFDDNYSCTVTGVLKNIPENSHIRFSYLVPFDFLVHRGQQLDTWRRSHFYTYVLLRENSDYRVVNQKTADILQEHGENVQDKLVFQPLSNIHLHRLEGGGPIIYVYIFFAVALFIVLIASVNYVNLITARSSTRAGEVELRKVVGAQRSDIIKQFFTESLLTSIISIVFSVVMVYLLLPVFNDISGKHISLLSPGNITLISGIIGSMLCVSIIAGSYPSLFLSTSNPVKVLKGSVFLGMKKVALRKVLLTLQFVLSVSLMIGAAMVANQLHFIRNKNLGYEKANLIYMDMGSMSGEQYETVKHELMQNPAILSVTASNSRLLQLGMETTGIDWEGRNPERRVNIQLRTVDYDYLKTFKMEMVQGRFFSRDFSSDASEGFIINEAAAGAMGIDSPIGKWFSVGDRRGTIIGIVKDFHFHSLHDRIEPLVFYMDSNWNWYLFARVNYENINSALETIEDNWERINPGKPFTYSFLDESVDNLYITERHMGRIINYFTVFAIFIGCLGLFGLSSFAASQRTKEIGVRKVLGASIAGIVTLLTKEFLTLVIVANGIAMPLAYLIMRRWLHNFAYRMNINNHVWVFFLVGILSLFIALLTMSFQSVRAARANPAITLKCE